MSPAQRYAADRQRRQTPEIAEFTALYPFGLDPFQQNACVSVAAGKSVLVAAPTGAGKTVVGEFAIHLALQTGRKCFYTTPIKALSNQKFNDLVERYGPEHIGLLTGDVSINGEAPIVVMTTEVLRNMLYANSSTLLNLAYVVMDEVHYLADRFRGAVWEEVIIHLPASVSVIALSATVSNAEEFGAWLATVRGDCDVIVEEHRPVPLWQHVMAGQRLYDLFVDEDQEIVNPDLVRLAREEERNQHSRHQRPAKGGRRARSTLAPWRSDAIERLQREGLLPAIHFIFSRAACDDAVQQLLASGIRLTTSHERREIREYALEHTRSLPDEDLTALGFDGWVDALERGIASHHAGLLPAFKEVVEHLFQSGLLKVVFATETLALGINMPARSVVLEKLVKWNGESHVELTPGEYTQLTGRAGRRGIDIEGHGVVLWHQGLDPRSLAGLASTRTYPLRSSFQPSYNMAVNLIARLGRHSAREVLETSFAQFQADRSVVGLATEIRRLEEGLEGYRDAMACHLGNFTEYAELRERLSRREKNATREAALRRRDAANDAMKELKPGDVIIIASGKRAGPALVLDAGFGRSVHDDRRPMIMTAERQVRRISASELGASVEVVAHIRIPKHFSPRNAGDRKVLASQLHEAAASHLTGGLQQKKKHARDGHSDDAVITEIRQKIRSHPCHGCSDREQHARWSERYFRAKREISDLEGRVAGRTNSIAKRFDRILRVLAELGYVTESGDDAKVTDDGNMLMRVYSEADLLVGECVRRGIWNGLDAADLAAACSSLLFESRSMDDDEAPRLPKGEVRQVLEAMTGLWDELHGIEERHGITVTRTLDPGFAWSVHRWANGTSLQVILMTTDLTAGDFVRWIRQIIDLLGQIAQAVPADDPLRLTAHEAIDRLNRGVVAPTARD